MDIPLPLYTAVRWTEELLRVIDPELQAFTAADRKLMGAFGDTIHQNAGTQIHGACGRTMDRRWQHLHGRIAAGKPRFYNLGRGRIAHRFINLLTAEMNGAREGLWNSERFLCFPASILQMLRGMMRTTGEIKLMLEERMNVWEEGRYCTIVKSVEGQWNRGNGLLHAPKTDVESVG